MSDNSAPSSATNNSIPVGSCPICMCLVEDATTATPCNHIFCHECITRWIHVRPNCPLCRQIIRSLHHRVSTNPLDPNARLEDQVEDVAPSCGYLIQMGPWTIVQTPIDSPLYLVAPVPAVGSPLFYYMVRPLEPDTNYFLASIPPGALWAYPENLEHITNILESYGITRIIPGIHPNTLTMSVTPWHHPSFLDQHRNHHNNQNHGIGNNYNNLGYDSSESQSSTTTSSTNSSRNHRTQFN